MISRKTIVIGSVIAFLIICIEIGIIVGVYVSLNDQDNSDIQDQLNRRIRRHAIVITEEIRQFVYIVYIGDSTTTVIPYPNVTLEEFVDLFQIEHSPVAETHNEFKFVPIIANDDRTSFEDLMKMNIKPDYEILQLDENFQLVPAANRSTYCPLTWLAPNTTEALYPFLGTDLCNVTSWSGLIVQMNQNSNFLYSNERFIAREQEYVFDIGKCITTNLNETIGYSIVSFFLSPVMRETLTNVFGNDLAKIRLTDIRPDGHNLEIFESEGFNETSTSFSNYNNYTFVENNHTVFRWNLEYRYTDRLIDLLSSDTALIFLIVLLLIFVTIDVAIVVIVLMYYRKKTSEKNKTLQIENTYIAGMVNYVNHEIRNPLNGVLGLLDVTKMSLEEQKDIIQDYKSIMSNIDTAYKSGLLIRHIVNDVLDVRRLEEGRLTLNDTHINMNEFLVDFNKLIQRKVQEHINIEFRVENNTQYIVCDRSRLMQILLNLVTNAFKFTEEGNIHLKIFYVNHGNTIRFECVDTGIGIPPEKQSKIFQRFIQVEQDKLKNLLYTRSGFGLGLYLCKMLVELMQGEIGFDSTYNKGSTFWIELPKNPNPPDQPELTEIVLDETT